MYKFLRSNINIIVSLLIILSACLALLVSSRSEVRASNANITLSVISGPPSLSLNISGTGFGSSEMVTLYFDKIIIGYTGTGTDGSFLKQSFVPKTALPGSHTFKAIGRVSGLLAQATFLVQTNWSTFGFNQQHTHYNPYENVLNSSNVSRLVLDWSYTTGNIIDTSPAVVGGVVYIGSRDKNLYAINASTGKVIWQYTLGDTIIASSPAIANGIAYIGANDGKLYALNTTTGTLLWSYTTGSYINSSPAVANGIVYIGSDKLYAFRANTGTLLWSIATGTAVGSSPTVAEGVVYVGSWDNNGKLYAINAQTGSVLWSYTTNGPIYSSPAVANGIVYVGSYDQKLYAINTANGTLLWSYLFGSSIVSSPTVANGVVYIGSTWDENLYAFNATIGTLLWSYNLGYLIHSSPAVVNGVVYIGSENNILYAFHLPGSIP